MPRETGKVYDGKVGGVVRAGILNSRNPEVHHHVRSALAIKQGLEVASESFRPPRGVEHLEIAPVEEANQLRVGPGVLVMSMFMHASAQVRARGLMM